MAKKKSTGLVSLEDLEPSLRFEVENGSATGGRPTWAVVTDGKLHVPETETNLTRRVESLRNRAEIMNRRLREEMRYGDHNDPGFTQRDLLKTSEYLDRYLQALRAL